jgi:hypothetical protein
MAVRRIVPATLSLSSLTAAPASISARRGATQRIDAHRFGGRHTAGGSSQQTNAHPGFSERTAWLSTDCDAEQAAARVKLRSGPRPEVRISLRCSRIVHSIVARFMTMPHHAMPGALIAPALAVCMPA